ncbi:hypothetical protein ACI78Q_03310 [Geodermatophilus sp. SYSU D00705]
MIAPGPDRTATRLPAPGRPDDVLPADRAVDVAAAALTEHPGAVIDQVDVHVDSDLTVPGRPAFPG